MTGVGVDCLNTCFKPELMEKATARRSYPRVRAVPATYAGQCRSCRGPIRAGDPVVWIDGLIVHDECG